MAPGWTTGTSALPSGGPPGVRSARRRSSSSTSERTRPYARAATEAAADRSRHRRPSADARSVTARSHTARARWPRGTRSSQALAVVQPRRTTRVWSWWSRMLVPIRLHARDVASIPSRTILPRRTPRPSSLGRSGRTRYREGRGARGVHEAVPKALPQRADLTTCGRRRRRHDLLECCDLGAVIGLTASAASALSFAKPLQTPPDCPTHVP